MRPCPQPGHGAGPKGGAVGVTSRNQPDDDARFRAVRARGGMPRYRRCPDHPRPPDGSPARPGSPGGTPSGGRGFQSTGGPGASPATPDRPEPAIVVRCSPESSHLPPASVFGLHAPFGGTDDWTDPTTADHESDWAGPCTWHPSQEIRRDLRMNHGQRCAESSPIARASPLAGTDIIPILTGENRFGQPAVCATPNALRDGGSTLVPVLWTRAGRRRDRGDGSPDVAPGDFGPNCRRSTALSAPSAAAAVVLLVRTTRAEDDAGSWQEPGGPGSVLVEKTSSRRTVHQGQPASRRGPGLLAAAQAVIGAAINTVRRPGSSIALSGAAAGDAAIAGANLASRARSRVDVEDRKLACAGFRRTTRSTPSIQDVVEGCRPHRRKLEPSSSTRGRRRPSRGFYARDLAAPSSSSRPTP